MNTKTVDKNFNFLFNEDMQNKILKNYLLKKVLIDIQVVYPELSDKIISFSDDFFYNLAIIPEFLLNMKSLKMIQPTVFELFAISPLKISLSLDGFEDTPEKIEEFSKKITILFLKELIISIRKNNLLKDKIVNNYYYIVYEKLLNYHEDYVSIYNTDILNNNNNKINLPHN
jgi:hypothetical protein